MVKRSDTEADEAEISLVWYELSRSTIPCLITETKREDSRLAFPTIKTGSVDIDQKLYQIYLLYTYFRLTAEATNKSHEEFSCQEYYGICKPSPYNETDFV